MSGWTPSPGEARLLKLPRFADAGAAAIKPGLERIRALLDAMGNPDRKFDCVLVGGTNGKGSVASMLAAIATASGIRTALHTSPHLFSVRERMRIDGVPAPTAWLDQAVTAHEGALARIGPSFFEATVALSLLYFAERQAELAVVEVGLGGRLDATNALDPVLSVITRIALDHQDVLGDSLEAIAHEKANIARWGRILLTSVEPGAILDEIATVAAAAGASTESIRETVTLGERRDAIRGMELKLTTPYSRYDALRIGLHGEHQAWNAALSIRSAELVLGSKLEATSLQKAVRDGVAGVTALAGLRGRGEVLATSPLVMVDVAHNADGLSAALSAFNAVARGEQTVVIGLMRDKDVSAIARVFAPFQGRIVCVGMDSERAFAPAALAEHLRAAGANAVAVTSVHTALLRFRRDAAPEDGLLATGSHLIAADAIAAVAAG